MTYHYVISVPIVFISKRYYAIYVSLISAISHAPMTDIYNYFINSTPQLKEYDLRLCFSLDVGDLDNGLAVTIDIA